MAVSELCFSTAAELGRLISRREVSPVEVVDAFLARIQALDPALNCYVTVVADAALAAAEAAEREIGFGNYRGPLHGVPVALKDLFDLAGAKTTASSRILAENVATKDSAVTRRLKQAGAVILGKTNLHEFAFGITTNNPHYGPTRNPWDLARVPGGSSGGSGAAVAASLTCLATGTDTGGSIRIPAALCGIVGLKPTFGRVSKAGVVPLAWSLDHAGPMTKTVEDTAIMMDVIAGYDPDDPSSAQVETPGFRAAIGADVSRLRIGVPGNFFFDDVDDEVASAVEAAARLFASLGVAVEDVSLPHVGYASAAFPVTIQSEAAAFHEPWLLSRPQDYGADVRQRLETGRTALATEYINAQRARAIITADFQRALGLVDALIVPTVPAAAAPIGEETVTIGGRQLELRPTYTRFTSPINLTGLPSLAMPCGFTRTGLPVGFQLVGRFFEEPTLLSLGHSYQMATDWHKRRPPVERLSGGGQ